MSSRDAAEDPYEHFLSKNRDLERAANLIIEGISEFALLSSSSEFGAKARDLREKVVVNQPTTLRELIEGSFRSKRIDRLTLRRFSLAARAAEVTIGHSPWHHQIVCALLLSRGTIVQLPNGAGKTLAIALAAAAGALAGNSTHIVTSNDYLAERDCRWMGRLYQLLGLTASVLFTAQTIHFKHGVLEPNGVTLRMAPVSDQPEPASIQSVEETSLQEPGSSDPLQASTAGVASSIGAGTSNASQTGRTDQISGARHSQILRQGSGPQLFHATESAYIVDPSLDWKQVLSCDVVYGRIETFGFAFLRDNTAMSAQEQTLSRRDALIIDECDSVLLDDLRTPLVLSRPGARSETQLETVSSLHDIASALSPGVHFVVNGKSVEFTYDGVDALRVITGQDLFTPQMGLFALGVLKALEAIHAYRRDEDYIVHEGQIVLIEEKSGRLLFGRRHVGGLHAALEYKEGLRISDSDGGISVASITIKHFARTYSIVSGTSGAIGVPEEYQQFYGLESVEIEPYRLTRRDHPDLVYRTRREAIEYGVIPKAISASQNGQPVLINAPSQREVREIAEKLTAAGVFAQVLDVNTVRTLGEEAEKVKRAGSPRLVTVSSNLAARGTDIILSEEAKAFGGLFVIGLQRAMDRRYDDQLQGRAGRHGDPGDAVFVVSLEDDLMRQFAPEWASSLLQRLGLGEGEEIESKLITQRIRVAQRAILRREHASRLSVVEYDDILDRHRTLVYRVRQKILEKSDISAEIMTILENWVYVWQQVESKRGSESFEAASFEPFSKYLDRTEIDRIVNVRGTKARSRVLRDLGERELMKMLRSSSQAGDWHKTLLLGKLDQRWQQYLSLEAATRENLALYPSDEAAVAKYAQAMEEHFDSFFIEVGGQAVGDMLRYHRIYSPA